MSSYYATIKGPFHIFGVDYTLQELRDLDINELEQIRGNVSETIDNSSGNIDEAGFITYNFLSVIIAEKKVDIYLSSQQQESKQN